MQITDRVGLHDLEVIPHSTSLLQQRVLVDRVGIRPQKHELSLAVGDDVRECLSSLLHRVLPLSTPQ